MASNISVVLTIDNQQYIASLNKAEQETKQFATAARGAADTTNASFNRLSTSSQALAGHMNNLKGIIAGGAFLGFASSALSMADAVDDLSKATGFSIERILTFKKVTALAGGDAEAAARGITTLYTQIDAARQGSAGAQDAFLRLGVSLNDLSTLDEGGLFEKSLTALSQMPQSAAKTAIQAELLGKAFRGVTIDEEFVSKLQAGEIEAQKVADSIKRAADLSDKFSESIGKLKVAFLDAFGPIFEILAKITEMTGAANLAFRALAVVITTFLAVSGIGLIARGIVGVVGAVRLLTTSLQGVRSAASGINLAKVLVGGATAVGTTALVSGVFEDRPGQTGSKAPAEAQPVIDANKAKRDSIADVASAYLLANQKARDAIALETSLIGTSKAYSETQKALADIQNKETDAIKKLTDQKEKLTAAEQRAGLGGAIDEQIKKIRESTAAEKEALAQTLARKNQTEVTEAAIVSARQRTYDITKQLADLKFDTATMGMSELAKRTAQVAKASDDWVASTIQGLANAQGISVEAFRQLYPEQVAKVYAAATQGLNDLTEAGKANFAQAQKINDLNYGVQQRIGFEKELTKIYDDMATMGLGEIEKKYYAIDAAARDSAKTQIDAIDKIMFSTEELARGMSIRTTDPERVKNIIDSATAGTEILKRQSANLYNASRTFSAGWNKAFKQYADDANNAAKAAERIFNKAFQGIEDLLVDFVKTGKFEWKAFVADMAEELLRSQIKQLLAGIGGALGLGNIGGGGQLGDSPTNPLYVMDIGGGGGAMGTFGGMGAFGNPGAGFGGLISGGGFGGMVGGQQGGIFGGVSNIFGSVTDTIGSVFGGITDAVGSVWDSVSGMFDGWFANGGSIGARKFGIVGENGPELVSGPANVTPMTGSTNVTYNINAVDAMSFKQMIARDPSFIHAVAMQGAKGIPGRY